MVRKTVFSRDDVLRAALAVVEKERLTQLTARRVAEELGSSTAPVYSNFRSMEALIGAVKASIAEMLLEFTRARHTDNEFLNMGVGVLEFARAKPGLYCAIFMQRDQDDTVGLRVMEDMLARMADVPELAALPAVERVILLRKMAVFTHGLASQFCGGFADAYSWDEILALLAEAGRAMVADAYQRPERTPEEIALLGRLCQAPPHPDTDSRDEIPTTHLETEHDG